MEKATRILNVCTLILIVITGFYIHLKFDQILNDFSLILLWGIITLLIGLQLEYTFELTKRISFKVAK